MGYWWWDDTRKRVRKSNLRWIPLFVILLILWLFAYFVLGIQIK